MSKHFVTDKSFYLKLASIGLPIAGQSIITHGVNLADNIMLGRLGEIQMSGANLANNFINIFFICCMGLGMGASVLTSRYWGRHDSVSLKKSIALMYRTMLVLAALFALAVAILPRGIMSMYSPEKEVVSAGSAYLLILIPTFFLQGFSLTTMLVLRSVGKATIPFFASIGAFLINIFCNWVFIFGKLGMPRMEIKGAALGTLLARIFEFVFITGYFLVKDQQVGMRLRDLTMKCSDQLKEYARISIPVLISDSLLGLGSSAVAVVMGHIGSSFVSANAITTITQQVSTIFLQSVSQSSCMIIGVTLGEEKVDEVKKQAKTFLLISIVLGLVGCGAIMLLKNPIISAYNITEETKDLAYTLMDAVSIIVLFQAINGTLTKGVLRGGGDTRFLMVADILFLWCAAIPFGALAGLVWHLPVFWIYFLLRVDQFLKIFLAVGRMFSWKWIKKIRSAGDADIQVPVDIENT